MKVAINQLDARCTESANHAGVGGGGGGGGFEGMRLSRHAAATAATAAVNYFTTGSAAVVGGCILVGLTM